MSTSPSELMDRAASASGLRGLFKQGLGGILLAISTGIISGVLSVTQVVVRPIDALAGALAELAIAIFGSPARIVIAGATQTAESLSGAFNLGPLTFALGIGSVLAGLWVVGRYRDEEETGNLVPGLPFDVPFVGESEEAGDE